MKRMLKILLALALILSVVAINKQVFAQDEGYTLKEDGGNELLVTNDENDITNYMKDTFVPDPSKTYTLTLYEDLKLPSDGVNLKSLILKGNITLEGNGHKLTGDAGLEKGKFSLIEVTDGSAVIKNISLEGEEKYQGVHISKGKSAMVENSVIVSCYPRLAQDPVFGNLEVGGGICAEENSTLKVVDTNISKCGPAYYGGAIFGSDKSTIEVIDSEISNNEIQGGCGGGIAIIQGKSLILKGCKVIKNTSTDLGGGIYSFSTDFIKIEDSEISENSSERWGGGIDFYVSKKAEITNTKILKNTTKELGGGIHIFGALDLKIKDCNISENHCDSMGGGIATSELCMAKIEIENSNFTGNNCVDFGGGLSLNQANEVKINNSTFSNNTSSYGGGAIALQSIYNQLDRENSKPVEITNSTITGNTSDDDSYGGGIAIIDTETNFKNTKILKNSSGYGGGIYSDSLIKIENSVVSGNKAVFLGGGIYGSENEYKDPEDMATYEKINISNDVIFSGNKAEMGYYNPAKNYKDFVNLGFKTTSLENELVVKKDDGEWEKVRSLLNNYDISYINPITTTVYDPNGGLGKLFVEEVPTPGFEDKVVKDRSIKIKSPGDVKISKDNYTLREWNTSPSGSGAKYMPDKTVEKHKGNLYLNAIWNEVKKDEINFIVFPVKPKEETHIAYIKGYPDSTVRPEGKITRAEAVTMVVRLKAYPMIEGIGIYKDVAKDAWYAPYVDVAYRQGILEEKEGEAFRPDDNITRGELAQLISHIDKKNDAKAPFTDIEGYKYKAAIDQSYGNERIIGYPDNTFRPEAEITRAETVAMLNRLFERKVKEEGLKEVTIDTFKDLKDKNYWAYYEIIEASHTHTYARIRPNTIEELWKTIIR